MNSSTVCMVWSWEGCLTQVLRHLLPLPRCLRPPRLPQRHRLLALRQYLQELRAMMNSSTGCMEWSWEGCLTQSLNHHPPLPHCLRPPRLPQRHQHPLALNLLLSGTRAMMNSSTGCMVWSWGGYLTKSLRHLLLPPRLSQHQVLPVMRLCLRQRRAMIKSSTGCMVWIWLGCLTQSLEQLPPLPRCLLPPCLPQRHQQPPALCPRRKRVRITSYTGCMV